MKILLFGKNGQLGRELQHTLAQTGNIYAPTSSQINFSNLKAIESVIYNEKPDLIVNAAGYTSVDLAEKEIDLAMLLNEKAPAVIAESAARINSVFIHYSTDYVFDGSKGSLYVENDSTNPLNIYGQSKLQGENAIRQAGGIHLILRTSWMYGLNGRDFVSRVLLWARQQERMRIVTDQVGSPTWSRMVAEVTASLIAHSHADFRRFFSERKGVFNLSGSGSVSRYDFAHEILHLDPNPEEQVVRYIEPSLTDEFPTPARRPLVTPLDCSRFEETFGISLPTWEHALRLAMGK